MNGCQNICSCATYVYLDFFDTTQTQLENIFFYKLDLCALYLCTATLIYLNFKTRLRPSETAFG